jgi:hypothetical protein
LENYFNYFTEIEEHFQRHRSSMLLLSTLDWALIETWKDAGIPLEAVLRGIDSTFEHYAKRPARARKINGLAFCSQEVLSAAEGYEVSCGGHRAGDCWNQKCDEGQGCCRDRCVLAKRQRYPPAERLTVLAKHRDSDDTRWSQLQANGATG